MKPKSFALLVIFCLPFSILYCQTKHNFKIVCYNVENFFDCVDDSLTDDAEFLIGGIRGWNTSKYLKKQANIAKVVSAIGGWEPPALVGLCEVESEKCLSDLTLHSPLKNLKYKYLHHESPDPRGVDVALLYQPHLFHPYSDKVLRIRSYQYPTFRTRDILFISGKLPNGDTLHVFVCHFPSRLSGELESEEKRVFVASVLKTKVDSLFLNQPSSNIVIMGDFNDFPTNKSLLETLTAKPLVEAPVSNTLYNLMYHFQKEGKGTNKHEGDWGMLDQIIVSGNLLRNVNHVTVSKNDAHIFDADFLLENDTKYLGKQLKRTYIGMKYHEGFSDHLPVYVDFWY